MERRDDERQTEREKEVLEIKLKTETRKKDKTPTTLKGHKKLNLL